MGYLTKSNLKIKNLCYNIPMFKNIYKETIPEVLNKLKTSKDGLKKKDIAERKETYGLNELPEAEQKSIFKMIFAQINNPLIYVLFLTAIFSLSIGHEVDAIIIMVVVVLNLCIGIYHEIKADKIIKGLESFSAPTCMVRRDGKIVEIEATELVPGDIVLLKEGDKIPADLRLIYALNFTTIEAPLTGESLPVEKSNVALKEDTQLAERKNMAYKGTIVAAGEGEGVVVHTGTDTEIGKIATTLNVIEREKTLFLKRTSRLTRTLAIIATAGAVLVFLIGVIRGMELNNIILFTVASFVSAIPEGLPAVMTVVLSVAAYRLAKKKSVVRSLSSVETLSSVTTIITDKTGTLTQNSMTITKMFLGDKREIDITGKTWEPMGDFFFKKEKMFPREDKFLKFTLPLLAIVNKAEVNQGKDGEYEIFGDPTEASRVVLAEKAGYVKKELLEEDYKILEDVPYSQDTKYRGMILKDNKRNKTYAVLVGGAENILEITNYALVSKKKVRKIDEHKDAYLKKMKKWTKEAMRIQAIAFQEIDEKKVKELKDVDYKKFVFLATFGIHDPIRDNVPKAIEKAQSAGIRVIMATGDNKETATAIGKQVGIEHINKEFPYAMEEVELQKLDEKEFRDAVKNVSIFARLVPDTKFKIAEILQEEDEIIAMTGDGVNDALALKKANIGISMGIIGTDAAREASDMILMDDNFATIVDAIEEGLTVFRNLRQTSLYLLSTNLAEDVFIILALVIGTSLPLLPIHILWLNLLTDGLLDVSLATEDTHEDVWEDGMKKRDEQIIDKKQFFTLALAITILSSLGLITFLNFAPPDLDPNILEDPALEKPRTMTFVMLTFAQIFFIFSLRSPTISIFKLGFFTNKYLFISIFVILVLTTLLVEVPYLADIFRFTQLTWQEILIMIPIATIPLFIMEFYKLLKRNGLLPK